MSKIKLIRKPKVCLIAATNLLPHGIDEMAKMVMERRPECGIENTGFDDERLELDIEKCDLFKHDGFDEGRWLTDAELLVELAGKKCYDSFNKKSSTKSNKEYIENTQKGEFPHASIMYHPTFTFYIEGVSRRVSHEFIRHYVGCSGSEQGSPSQESTRYTLHTGEMVIPPRYLGNQRFEDAFEVAMWQSYNDYENIIDYEEFLFEEINEKPPKGMDRKRIYEAAAGLLPMQAATSWVWSCNPVSLAKMIGERTHKSADLEFKRLAELMRDIAVDYAPNLFKEGL